MLTSKTSVTKTSNSWGLEKRLGIWQDKRLEREAFERENEAVAVKQVGKEMCREALKCENERKIARKFGSHVLRNKCVKFIGEQIKDPEVRINKNSKCKESNVLNEWIICLARFSI